MAKRRTFTTRADKFEHLLRDGFQAMSKRLRGQFEQEKKVNLHNMESGIPLEDFFRDEFGSLFREPYGVEPGTIVDHQHDTCGDCDFVIFERRLAPLLKPPAAPGSRRKIFAFETTFGIIEVKQTLTLGAIEAGKLKPAPEGTLWEACSKVFAYKQLHRLPPERVQWGINHPIGMLFFYNCDLDLSSVEAKDALLREFLLINAEVSPEERVNGLYVLDRFSVNWTFTKEPSSTTFLTLQHAIETPGRPVWLSYSDAGEDTLYGMFTQIWSTLVRTQLAGPDFLNEYGGATHLRGRGVRSMAATEGAHLELLQMGQAARTDADKT